MQRPSQATRPKKGEFSCRDEEFRSNYPLFSQGLCDEWWDDGKPRTPWTFKVSFTAEGVQLAITDKDNKLVAFTSSEGFTEALNAVETALGSGGLSWRKSKW